MQCIGLSDIQEFVYETKALNDEAAKLKPNITEKHNKICHILYVNSNYIFQMIFN